MVQKKIKSYKIKSKKIRKIIYLICFILLILFVIINAPFLYQKDHPESFGFFSDSVSVYKGLQYKRCELKSIDNSISDTVDFYFGFVEEGRNKGADEYFFMYHGNCGHAVEFNDSLLQNDIPDYLIEFPFNIREIGRSCRKKIFINKDKNPETIELDDIPASHYNKRNNTLITEWSTPLSIDEFRFFSTQIYKKISFDTLSINYLITDRWMFTPYLINNQPNSFIIKLKIPTKFEIKNLENIEKCEKIGNYIDIETDLKLKNNIHLILINNNKSLIKNIVNGLFTIFVLGIVLDIIIKFKNNN